METRNDANARKKLWDLIKDIRVALLVTHDAEGCLHSRPMIAQQEEFTGELWFFTPADCRKIDEITGDPRVLLTYAEPKDQQYVSLSGHAETVQDRAKINQLWREPMRTWFPKGPDDPNLALIRVEVERAEYWDAPSSTLIYAYGYLKARLTGEAPDPAETGKVDFTRQAS